MNKNELEKQVIAVLRDIYDPELPVSIYELGLIYDIKITDNSEVEILMTLTSPNCPVAGSLPGRVESELKKLESVGDVKVELTFDPPWSRELLSDAAKLELGMF